MLSINSEPTIAEAYVGFDNDIYNVGLEFTQRSDEISLYQNKPNPFESSTVIGFNLPKSGKATLTFFDITGKELKRVDGSYDQGYNEVRIDARDIISSGVVYYNLEYGEFSARKKMVIF